MIKYIFDIERFKELVSEGATYAEITKELGLPSKTIQAYIKKLGLVTKASIARKESRAKKLANSNVVVTTEQMQTVEKYIRTVSQNFAFKNGSKSWSDSQTFLHGMTAEDLAQDLRLVAHKAFQNFDYSKWDSTDPNGPRVYACTLIAFYVQSLAHTSYNQRLGNKCLHVEFPETIFSSGGFEDDE